MKSCKELVLLLVYIIYIYIPKVYYNNCIILYGFVYD